MKITHEYITKGPDLYMRQFWPEGNRDCWLCKYTSDEAATEAAVRWNDRKQEFDRLTALPTEGNKEKEGDNG